MNGSQSGYKPIGDYALIGNGRSAALVARDGSTDRLAWPRFDSPSIFSALLDTEQGGTFRVRPVEPFRSTRQYLPATAIIETAFVTDSGVCIVRDLMPMAAGRPGGPEHEFLREIEGIEGEVRLEIVCNPRPMYGRQQVTFVDRGPFGFSCDGDADALLVRSDLHEPLEISEDGGSVHAEATIQAGQRSYLSLSLATDAPAVIPLLGEAAQERIQQTQAWWETWSEQMAYAGLYREIVLRSAMTLKLLTYAPSGAIITAPTTSLPLQIGGMPSGDDRVCRLRDAAQHGRALWGLGYVDEANAFVNWLLHATQLTWPQLAPAYDIHGRSKRIRELTHLEGYAGSGPPWAGNDTHWSYQLDSYGALADVALQYIQHGGHVDRDAIRFLRGIAETITQQWRNPDDGTWGVADGPEHHTHSKALCWVALDRLITLHDRHRVPLANDRMLAERGTLRAEIEERGYSERLGTYTLAFNDDTVDASLLMLPLYGYLDATHLRMRATYDAVLDRLGTGRNRELIYRNLPPDGTPDEGAYAICTCWAVECLALAGDLEAATTLFEQFLTHANDLGLFGAAIDPTSGATLGNFPDSATHAALINAALAINQSPDQDTQRRG